MNLCFNPFPRLTTKRLSLEPLNTRHIPKLFGYYSDKSHFPHAEIRLHQSLDDTKAYVEKMKLGVLKNQWIIWAICLKETHEIVGTISVWNFNMKKAQGELGYGLFPEARGQGFMLEALERVLRYTFDEVCLETIQAFTSPENIPSIQVLEALQFSYIDTLADDYSNGKLMSIYEMSSKAYNINLN